MARQSLVGAQERSGARQVQGPLPSIGECILEPPGASVKAAEEFLFIRSVPSQSVPARMNEAIPSPMKLTRAREEVLLRAALQWPAVSGRAIAGATDALDQGGFGIAGVPVRKQKEFLCRRIH